jgi:hypothetical protein
MSLTDRRWVTLVFLLGLVLSAVMVPRAQVAGDQLNLLGLGWRFAFEGEWAQHGNPTSAGLFTPGGFSALVTGLPLLIWPDFRVEGLVTLLTHLIAYLLLDRLVARILGPHERLLFAILYWLSPWRLYHSAFLWNPNFLLLTGALHLWTAYSLRERPRFWASFAHVLVLGLSMQVAVHTLPLVAASLLLWWRGYIRIHLPGAAAAAALIGASLLPWMLAAVGGGMRVPGLERDLGADLMIINTTLRAAGYWVRYSTLALSKEIFCLDFAGAVGPSLAATLKPLVSAVKGLVYWLTVPAALWANYRLWKGSGPGWKSRFVTGTDRAWLTGVVRWSLIAALVTFSLVPSTVMRWYLLGLFHLAVLPLVLAAGDLLRGSAARRATRGLLAYAVASALTAMALPWGAPMYRCGGERCVRSTELPPLRADHPMLDDLGIRQRCPVIVDDPEGWWIQTLPEPEEARPSRSAPSPL